MRRFQTLRLAPRNFRVRPKSQFVCWYDAGWPASLFFFSSRSRHTSLTCDWSSDVCSSDLNSLAATISDNTAYALMGQYRFERLRFFAGYQYIKYENPKTPLSAGFINIGGYVLAFVNNTAYNNPKMFQVYWTGLRYRVVPRLEL